MANTKQEKLMAVHFLCFQTSAATHLEYLRNTASMKTLFTSENKTGIILTIKPLNYHLK